MVMVLVILLKNGPALSTEGIKVVYQQEWYYGCIYSNNGPGCGDTIRSNVSRYSGHSYSIIVSVEGM